MNLKASLLNIKAVAPKDKGAGMLLKVKLRDRVKEGQVLFKTLAERSIELESATGLANKFIRRLGHET